MRWQTVGYAIWLRGSFGETTRAERVFGRTDDAPLGYMKTHEIGFVLVEAMSGE